MVHTGQGGDGKRLVIPSDKTASKLGVAGTTEVTTVTLHMHYHPLSLVFIVVGMMSNPPPP